MDLPSSAFLFAGHVGHLTSDQQQSFATFKENLIKANLYAPGTDTSKPSHDEPTLLRFLRARAFNPTPAQKQFADAEAWRKRHDVDNLYATFDPAEMESAKRFYPQWTGRREKNGLPLYVYRLASLSPIQKELDAVPAERRYQRVVALYELMMRFTLPLCSHIPHPSSPTPLSSTMSIIDLQDVTFGAMWTLRNHLQEASRLATANYPETLHMIAVVNSPSFFPTIWGWLKGWFDEGTRNKIHVLGKDPGPKLLELVHPQDLPKVYGGELAWVFGDAPTLEDVTKEIITNLPTGPAIFENGRVSKPRQTE